ncbi:hypothetical protein PIB30_037704 [Stylosanthes scabra]|uniref:Uncharacterized protein n=1 Tax=Stylosanthes scabra TaxID=79078 RepID=A0ABU6YG82_9FABA|nr:hypothetical protein [Stylosanthes scabra]
MADGGAGLRALEVDSEREGDDDGGEGIRVEVKNREKKVEETGKRERCGGSEEGGGPQRKDKTGKKKEEKGLRGFWVSKRRRRNGKRRGRGEKGKLAGGDWTDGGEQRCGAKMVAR